MSAIQEKLRLLTQATAHLRDEYRSDDLRRGADVERRLDYGRPALAGPTALAGPKPVQAHLALGRPNATAITAPADTVPAPVPGGLPALLGGRGGWGGDLPVASGWARLRDMPGGAYLHNEGIRAFMRRQHRQWPCFARHEQIWKAAGRDPLGMVSGLNLVHGMPDADPGKAQVVEREIHAVASWIRANGVVLAADRIDHGQMLGSYVTEVVLATTDDKSFLLVREPAVNGFEGMHVYCWDGGTAVYRDGVGRAFIEQKAQATAAPPVAIAPPEGRLPSRAPTLATPQPAITAATAERKTALRELPTATSPSIAALSDRLSPLRAAGFVPGGSKEGPFLSRREEDGSVIQLFGEKGKQLAKSGTFRIRSLDQAGVLLDERAVDDPEEALRAPSPGPRP